MRELYRKESELEAQILRDNKKSNRKNTQERPVPFHRSPGWSQLRVVQKTGKQADVNCKPALVYDGPKCCWHRSQKQYKTTVLREIG